MLGAIDLNADIGEGKAFDAELLKIVSSASVACGGHAGDEYIMAATLECAKKHRVITGAHPGFEDKENFGRKQLDLPAGLIAEQVVEQVARIVKIGKKTGQKISYVKLHGALYNLASRDYSYARTIFEALKNYDTGLAVLALDGSQQLRAASDLGFKTIAEAFADRAYDANGLLLSRAEKGAVLETEDDAVKQALLIAVERKIIAVDGVEINSGATSLCLHGDNIAALKLAQAIKNALKKARIKISAAIW